MNFADCTLVRRRFLAFAAGSPALCAAQADPIAGPIASPEAALNVLDFEAAARKVLPPAHFGYMATGVDDDRTLRANRDGFARIYLRPRRLVDVSRADLRTEIFGTVWDTPIGLAPVGNQKAFHPEGELPVASAAKAKRTLMMLSTATNTSVEDVTKSLGAPPWYQLYPSSKWEVTERLVKRVEAAGCKVMVLTIDTQAGRHTETFERARKLDSRNCAVCHPATPGSFFARKPMFQGIDTRDLRTSNPTLNWKDLPRLKSFSGMKLLIKGIETAEDARICGENGVDGLVVSNHGGRAEESGRGTIDCLPEVVEAVGSRVPVFLDGGIRRGTDIYKALAFGAKAVFIGRPYIWGLAAFGQPGVEKVIDILRRELDLVMRQCGATSVAQITRASVGRHGV
ncbi:MAG: alpha-hydroxy-acid oxidizing protein [Bryobacterales bacterium]|nr:alpha-hydroxy-acid oxidizing protein [Bryobacterales bacterium]